MRCIRLVFAYFFLVALLTRVLLGDEVILMALLTGVLVTVLLRDEAAALLTGATVEAAFDETAEELSEAAEERVSESDAALSEAEGEAPEDLLLLSFPAHACKSSRSTDTVKSKSAVFFITITFILNWYNISIPDSLYQWTNCKLFYDVFYFGLWKIYTEDKEKAL